MGAIGDRVAREILEDVKKKAHFKMKYVDKNGEIKVFYSLDSNIKRVKDLFEISNGWKVIGIKQLR